MADRFDSRSRRPGDDARRRRADQRVPPHNLDAEESLLGALLLSRDAVGTVAEMQLSADEFYKPAHQHIYDAVRSLMSSGEPIDAVTVAEELRRHGLLDEIGGLDMLLDLQNATPAISNVGRYGKIVQDTAALRRLIGVASEIAEIAYMEPDDVAKAIDDAESKVFEVAEQRVADSIKPLGELLQLVNDHLEKTYERGSSITGVATGYHDLDELLSGLQPNTLNIVGARPAMGKCVAWDTPIPDPHTGEVHTARELFEKGCRGEDVWVWSLDDAGRLVPRLVGGFVDDGYKPLFAVRTRSGRQIRLTAPHPLLTPMGWRRLDELEPGVRIAVPRHLPAHGTEQMPRHELDLLALFLAGAPGKEPNPVTEILRRHGVWGLAAHDKHVPSSVFALDADHVAHFLNRLFATDGSAWVAEAGYARVSLGSMSGRLLNDVQHLLLRFGIRSRVRRRVHRSDGTIRHGYELEIMDSASQVQFADRIGIVSKDAAVARVREKASRQAGGWTADTIPLEVWDDVVKAKGDLSWAEVSRRAGKRANHSWHPYRRSPRRDTVALLAEVLDDDNLRRWASPDIQWDEITEIVPVGEGQVYDLTVPETHNFVAADICVHNTAFALGIATNVAQTTNLPVLVFSLEMGHAELAQRILSSEARVDSQKLRTGRLTEADWSKVGRAIGRLEVPLFLDDNPSITVMEIRAKARRIKARYGGLALIVIDYLQLMSGSSGSENRQLEVSEMSRNLKILARELEVPIVALSQLSRQLESRADKRPMLADLRESGSLEQDADVVMFIYRDEVYNTESPDKGSAEVIVAKHRSGPIGTKRLVFLGPYTRFDNAARGV